MATATLPLHTHTHNYTNIKQRIGHK